MGKEQAQDDCKFGVKKSVLRKRITLPYVPRKKAKANRRQLVDRPLRNVYAGKDSGYFKDGMIDSIPPDFEPEKMAVLPSKQNKKRVRFNLPRNKDAFALFWEGNPRPKR